MMDGLGIIKYKSGKTYSGEWKYGVHHGHGVYIDEIGNKYQGVYERGELLRGKTIYNNGDIYIGEYIKNEINGRGKYLFNNGDTYLGELRNEKSNGVGKFTQPTGQVYLGEWRNDELHGRIYYKTNNEDTWVGYYQYDLKEGPHIYNNNQLFYYLNDELYNINFNIKNFIIDNPDKIDSKYITIMINLHGSDELNTKCKLINDDNHVRILSPVSCGKANFMSLTDFINLFNIVFNVCNINKDTSTYQKMEKILELINTDDMLHKINYDRQIVYPLIDHIYTFDDDTDHNNIILVDTNYNPIINHRSFINNKLYEHVNKKKNAELYKYDDIKQFNLLPEILEIINKKSSWSCWFIKKFVTTKVPNFAFYRSGLINSLLDLGYQTINIIDGSCRGISTSDDTALLRDYYNINNKYICKLIKQPNQDVERKNISIIF
jgi:hypothetical protein